MHHLSNAAALVLLVLFSATIPTRAYPPSLSRIATLDRAGWLHRIEGAV